jgi:hypothetical protein
MPFRFQRRVSTPFGRINFSKSGVSLTEGVEGAHVTLGTRGVRASLGLPGTGFGWFTQSRWSSRGQQTGAPQAPQRRNGWAALAIVLVLIGWLAILATGGGGH